MSWQEEREIYIEKLNKANESVVYLLKINSLFPDFIKDEDKTKIQMLQKEIEKYLKKLKKNKFEVAIIGLEKAGKSTFANALMKSAILPEDIERCTYTTTIVESIPQGNFAEIEFFTRKEFFDKVNPLLKEIGMEGSIEFVSEGDIDRHLDFLKEKDPEKHKFITTTREMLEIMRELKEIIEHKEEISQWLNQDKRVISGERLKEEVRKFIVDKKIARAVKKVKICSSALKELKDFVLYDVPGFDSPVQKHKEETKESMINADAIIFIVSIADKANLNDTQVDILSTVQDSYGQTLAEKMLVFVNKIDKQDSQKDLERAISVLKNELIKYKLIHKKNFFCGSAKAYLEKLGEIEGDIASKKLEALNEIDKLNAIDDLYERLKEFCEIDRFKIIKNVLNKLFADIKEIVETLIEGIEIEEKDYDEKKFNILDEFWEGKRNELIQKLSELGEELQKRGYELSKTIAQRVSDWIPTLKIDEEDIKRKHFELTTESILVEKPEKVNMLLREEIKKKAIEGFVDLCSEVAEEENQKIAQEVKNLIKSILLEDKKEIGKKLEEVIDNITQKFVYDRNAYDPLISRFASDIGEILLSAPITDKKEGERVKKFQQAEPNIESILIFDPHYNEELGFYKQELVRKLLVQTAKIEEGVNSLDKLLRHAKVALSYDEVKEEINRDIDTLEEIFKTTVLNAVQIEKPFKVSIARQIQALKNDIEGVNGIGEIKRFVNKHIKEILSKEFHEINMKIQNSKEFRECVEKCREILKEL